MVALVATEQLWLARAGMMAATLLASIILFFCAICLVRRRKDPARTGFTYLKIAFGVFTLFVFFDMCSYALSFAYTRARDHYYSGSDRTRVVKGLLLGEVYCFAVAALLTIMTDIFVFFMLLRISTGIVIAKTGAPDAMGRVSKLASYGIGGLLFALNIAQFGMKLAFNTKYYVKDEYLRRTPPFGLIDFFERGRQLTFAVHVLIFVVSLAVLARTVMVKLQTKTEPRVKKVSTLLIVCAVLWLLHTTYTMAAFAATVNLADATEDPMSGNYYIILDVVFSNWPQFILLTIAFCLGAKKRNGGLWSTDQPFMVDNHNGPATAWGYGAPADGPAMHQHHHHEQGWHSQQQHEYPPQQGWAPPTHEDTIGLNHQANGMTPQVR